MVHLTPLERHLMVRVQAGELGAGKWIDVDWRILHRLMAKGVAAIVRNSEGQYVAVATC